MKRIIRTKETISTYNPKTGKWEETETRIVPVEVDTIPPTVAHGPSAKPKSKRGLDPDATQKRVSDSRNVVKLADFRQR